MCETIQLVAWRYRYDDREMAKPTAADFKQLESALHDQGRQMSTLRAAIDVQFKRIAEMQAELDLLPHARRRRLALGLAAPGPSRNGHHRSHE